jgi:hypothetical protein
MRIRFLSEQIYDTGGPGKGPRFPEGFVLDEADVGKVLKAEVSPENAKAFLNRWLQRRVADQVDADVDASKLEDLGQGDGLSHSAGTPFGSAKRGRASKGLDDGKQVQKIDLKSLTRTELDKLAKKRGVDITGANNKGDVIAALEKAEQLGDD